MARFVQMISLEWRAKFKGILNRLFPFSAQEKFSKTIVWYGIKMGKLTKPELCYYP